MKILDLIKLGAAAGLAGTVLFSVSLSSADNSEMAAANKGDFVSGLKKWKANCSRCHNMRDPKDLRDDQWEVAVTHMRVRAGLTGQDARDILAFLQSSN